MSLSPEPDLARAVSLYQAGQYREAEATCHALCASGGAQFDAVHLGALCTLQQGKLQVAERGFTEAIALNPRSCHAHNNLGVVLLGLNWAADAVWAFKTALRLDPRFFEAQLNLGNAFSALGAHHDAVACYRSAQMLQAGNPDIYSRLAAALQESGQIEEAVISYRYAASLRPSDASIWRNLGMVLNASGRAGEAIAAFKTSIAQQPEQPDINQLLGDLLVSAGSMDDAAMCWQQLAAQQPGSSRVHYRLGEALRALDRTDLALASFHTALALDPTCVDAAFAIASLADVRGDVAAAIDCYLKVIALKPEYAAPHINLAGIYFRLGHIDHAIEHNRRAVAIAPAMPEAHNNLGNCYYLLKQYEEAIDCFGRALELDPALPNAVSLYQLAKRQICDWSDLKSSQARMLELVAAGHGVVDPFTLLWTSDDPALQLAAARQSVKRTVSRSELFTHDGPRREGKVRLAYLSPDFHDHPVGLLISDLLEQHNRDLYEVTAYSAGPPGEASSVRRRIVAAVDHFVDVRSLNDDEVARRIKADDIDILVDLAGHTHGNRMRALAKRPARVQITYLGFSGTTGADFFDYILVDPFVVPPEQQANYTEHLYHLPDCYMVNVRSRPPAATGPSREACGLPAKGFVFCCFNNTYKITPDVFAVWMRLMQATPGSVLWLKGDNPLAQRNLVREAGAREVTSDRLVFASNVDYAEHLARHRNADLFLDTFPYNAASTAGDALWMGLPIVTIAGRSFVARVAGSLLRAARAETLVTRDLAGYEALALELSRDRPRLEELKRMLIADRLEVPLFDLDRFRDSIERAYAEIWSEWRARTKDKTRQ